MKRLGLYLGALGALLLWVFVSLLAVGFFNNL